MPDSKNCGRGVAPLNLTRNLLILLFLSFLLHNNGWSQKSLSSSYTRVAPAIDGRISDGEWSLPDSATDFIQMEPDPGAPASEKSTVYLCHDSVNVYLAFIAYYQDPGQIVSRIQTRDQLTKSDDLIAVALDTYNDLRSAYVFFLNPSGTQIDMRVDDDGRNTDLNWDAEWQSATGRFQGGWVAEMAIPFKSIKYKKSLSDWGVNFGRIIRHNSETAWWSGRMSEDFRISQGGTLSDIEAPSGIRRIQVFPYGTLRYEDSDISGIHGKVKPDAGVDARIGLSSELTANLTVNPDFATVEGDQEKINLSRWELNFPEKRLFFQEGNEMFNTRIQTFYSRRVGDIYYGGKVTGKVGGINMNVLTARTIEDTARNEPSAWFTAVRVKGDILKSSSVGLTVVDKSWSGGYTRSLSADYLLNLGETWKLTGQFVGSAPGDLLTHSAWFARIAKENNIYHVHVRYSNTGENFRDNVNQTGFVRDDDMREVDSDLSYRWWMQDSFFKYISVESRNNVFWSHAGYLRSWALSPSVRFYLVNRISLDLVYYDEFKLYEKKFYNNSFGTELGYNTDEWASASLAHYRGRNYDRDFTLTSFIGKVKPFSRLALEYNLDWLEYSPDPEQETTLINVFSAEYYFTRDMWLRVFAQNRTSNERIYVYGQAGWRFKPPFGAVYLIYTSDDYLDIPAPDRLQSKVLFLKLTYPILGG